jgi:hypothetical protein
MVTAYRNVRGALKVSGTPTDPVYVVVEGISIITFNKPGTVTAIAPSTKTTIVSQVYTATTFENVVIISVSGTNYAKYFFSVNGSDKDIRRSGPDLNLTYDFTGAPFALAPGDVVDVKVEHFNAGNEDFEATIYGYA